MKLHPANFAHQYIFTGYGDGYILINQIRYEKNLIVMPDRLIEDWPVTAVSQLEIQHFENLISDKPEIIIHTPVSQSIFTKPVNQNGNWN